VAVLWEKVPQIFLKRLHEVCLRSFYLKEQRRELDVIKKKSGCIFETASA
jgi:hypothetical protein